MTERGTAHAQAYPLSQRRAHAEQHITIAAQLGWLELTQSFQIVRTYGLPETEIPELKKLKARFRNELSFGGEK